MQTIDELETQAYIAFHEWKEAVDPKQKAQKRQLYVQLIRQLKTAEDRQAAK